MAHSIKILRNPLRILLSPRALLVAYKKVAHNRTNQIAFGFHRRAEEKKRKEIVENKKEEITNETNNKSRSQLPTILYTLKCIANI